MSSALITDKKTFSLLFVANQVERRLEFEVKSKSRQFLVRKSQKIQKVMKFSPSFQRRQPLQQSRFHSLTQGLTHVFATILHSIHSYPSYIFVSILYIPAHSILSYPSYTYLSILYLPIPPIPSYPSYTFLFILYLHIHPIYSCPSYTSIGG